MGLSFHSQAVEKLPAIVDGGRTSLLFSFWRRQKPLPGSGQGYGHVFNTPLVAHQAEIEVGLAQAARELFSPVEEIGLHNLTNTLLWSLCTMLHQVEDAFRSLKEAWGCGQSFTAWVAVWPGISSLRS